MFNERNIYEKLICFMNISLLKFCWRKVFICSVRNWECVCIENEIKYILYCFFFMDIIIYFR